MSPDARNGIINAALGLAAHVTGLAPSLAGLHKFIVSAQGAAPELEEALGYFTSPAGQVALKHMQEVLSALSKTLPQHDEKDEAPAQQEQPAGWRLEWDTFQGYKWVRDE